ncbi:MAG: peptidoglycan synthetase [Chlorobi bacterium]|nr:peptidoglycan synthetase [Chlorobiota bacterium]
MKIHFISIGGAVMHNLAIALYNKGYHISGSDDEIFNPAKDRLKKTGILPEKQGWYPEKITKNLDAVILGMHAKENNPELLQAKKLNLKIYSFPEYLYEQTKSKTRVVLGGSHGKTTITSMVMHVLKYNNIEFDYMVGAQLKGFDTMVGLSNDSKIAIFEGDEYLSSAIDKRPKFHLYKPHIALLSGIAWDHINVFPSFENYVYQFKQFINVIEDEGILFYYKNDTELQKLIETNNNNIRVFPYESHPAIVSNNLTYLINGEHEIPITVFGDHNLQNIQGAKLVCNALGINDNKFYEAISLFKGASKRLQILKTTKNSTIFLDFAHAPSKLKATISAVKKQYPKKKLIACMELHTYSSLNKTFLKYYNLSMNQADIAIVFFNPEAIKLKNLEPLSKQDINKAFGKQDLQIFNKPDELIHFLNKQELTNSNLLFMSSGNFAGINLKELSNKLLS